MLKAQSRVSGIDVGIMLLDNQLPRPRGDVGNAHTFRFPVMYDVIADASTTRVVEESATGLLDNAIAAGRRLVGLGVRAVTTCCGFLAIYQRELAAALEVPVATSSLLQVPLVLRTLRPDQKVAILTVNASTLTTEHLYAVGIGEDQLERIVMLGLETTAHFYPMIVGKEAQLDVDRACNEVLTVARDAVAQDEAIGAFVFECTNLPPYAAAVRDATARPVWDATSMIRWLQDGVCSFDEHDTRSIR
jgi:hypothetical protein